MKLIVDRIEANIIILENESGALLPVPKALVPTAKEGDVIRITVDASETEKRKKDIDSLMNALFVD